MFDPNRTQCVCTAAVLFYLAPFPVFFEKKPRNDVDTRQIATIGRVTGSKTHVPTFRRHAHVTRHVRAWRGHGLRWLIPAQRDPRKWKLADCAGWTRVTGVKKHTPPFPVCSPPSEVGSTSNTSVKLSTCRLPYKTNSLLINRGKSFLLSPERTLQFYRDLEMPTLVPDFHH
ncbi:hypothetical protein ACLOJK_001286 [Asimina triloba]